MYCNFYGLVTRWRWCSAEVAPFGENFSRCHNSSGKHFPKSLGGGTAKDAHPMHVGQGVKELPIFPESFPPKLFFLSTFRSPEFIFTIPTSSNKTTHKIPQDHWRWTGIKKGDHVPVFGLLQDPVRTSEVAPRFGLDGVWLWITSSVCKMYSN